LSESINRIEKEREKQYQSYIAKKQLNLSLPLLINEYFRYLISSKVAPSPDSIREQFDFLGININLKSMMLVIIEICSNSIDVENFDGLLIQDEHNAVLKAVQEHFSEQFECICFSYSKSEIGILLTHNTQNKNDVAGSLLQAAIRFHQKVLSNMNLLLSIGISGKFADISQISAAFRQAKEAIEYQFFHGRGSVISYEEIKHVQLKSKVSYNGIEDSLTSALRMGQAGEIPVLIGDFFDKNCDVYPERLKNAVQRLYLVIYSNAVKLLAENEEEAMPACNMNAIKNFKTINELKQWLINELKEIADSLQRSAKSQSQRYVETAKTIIETKYYTDISLNSVANMIGLTPTYLSAIFKEVTDMTFTEYLIHIRIEKAKELICKKSYKIYEIAEMVGYTNVRYFSELFRKKTGANPNDFLKLK